MRPMPSPTGRNKAQLFIDLPRAGAAYDALPENGMKDDDEEKEKETLSKDAAGALYAFLQDLLTPTDLARFCELAGIDPGLSMDERRRRYGSGKIKLSIPAYGRAVGFLLNRLDDRAYDGAIRRLTVDASDTALAAVAEATARHAIHLQNNAAIGSRWPWTAASAPRCSGSRSRTVIQSKPSAECSIARRRRLRASPNASRMRRGSRRVTDHGRTVAR